MPDLTMDDSVRAVLDKFSWDAHPSKHLKHFEIGAFDLETSLATDEVMHITEQNVSDADVVALSKALKLMVPTNMKNVYLSSNRIGDEGCRHIAEAAACLPNFELLFLARNQIGDAGVAGIAQQLAAAPKLWQLVLTENQFGDEGVKALADAAISDAGAFGALKWLFLDGNNITDKGVQALATAMTTGFQGLTRLALQNTKLTNKGLKALGGAIEKGALPHCEFLYVQNNDFDASGKNALKKATRPRNIRCHFGWPPPMPGVDYD